MTVDVMNGNDGNRSGSTASVDAIVIGGGPAGLGAALGLCRQRHGVVVFDSGEYRNEKASHMHMVATWDHQHPHDFRTAARKELLSRYGNNVNGSGSCSFIDQPVATLERYYEDEVKPAGSGLPRTTSFRLVDASGVSYTAKSVVLATDSRDILPQHRRLRGLLGPKGISLSSVPRLRGVRQRDHHRHPRPRCLCRCCQLAAHRASLSSVFA